MRALEWLRTQPWDYCIIWRFGDDPSRYIQWIGCCCNGTPGVCGNVKEEIDATKQHFPVLCRDTYIKHSLKSKTCEKLAKIPFYLPLYSGIHGEVAMSAQPSWSHDPIGTQVIIPVDGGLIELYRSKQVPRDQETIETLMAQFNILSKHEIFFDTQTAAQLVHPKVEGSPNGSNLSLVSAGSAHVSPTRSVGKPMTLSGHAISGQPKGNIKTTRKTSKEQYQSKNLVTERNRRLRIKDGLFALRSLVPKISKMDRASIIGDAIEYIKELETNVQELQDELKRLEDNDSKSHEDEVEVCKPKGEDEHPPTNGDDLVSVSMDRKSEFAAKKRGGFLRIMETVDSLGLQVVDANVATCNGRVLNVLRVEAKGKDVVAKSLKDSLLHSWLSHIVVVNPTRSL
ncbi:hypothetical protein OSB04_022316 [Centaurea solstitialis]|uniref:BHLH domain-containing protein n=1 Tax=Centaurea solstitialis TaxID=347529 RepID=A0AA38TFQ9_9ASTR|nr:hypothetical protein OSB04_022316 [Centaurea solstitialis]